MHPNVSYPSSSASDLSLSAHYRKMMKAGGQLLEHLENNDPDLSNGGIRERLSTVRAELDRIIKEQLGGKADLHSLADRIFKDGDTALRMIRDQDEAGLRQHTRLLSALETIVRTDGSRPSFMIQNGSVNISSSPVGGWKNSIVASADLLFNAGACVGRIDVPFTVQGFAGTGFLIAENLIVTNRHVLQGIALEKPDGTWKLQAGVRIDFGHEFRGVDSVNPRDLARVVFSGKRPIDLGASKLDHSRLDLALIELAPSSQSAGPRMYLSLDQAPDWAMPDTAVYTIGYPGAPNLLNTPFPPSLFEQIFQSTYGCKRLAPGMVLAGAPSSPAWTHAHDATTLGVTLGR
ncbi:trypsin-like serine peptidase [Hymenobacter cellulosilyticus]|uniref:Serine protease n=1 Tax=Hymenobacter cellulosilyticus TaxID=2932248 RepID=A0A8T9QEI0_9BACT|nr:trypsin-like peptidase domain-containing protein [Hymenobacter cellulosilyticus]UOQ75262.1 serine protease [Hymenobacter cellulosilyticus]